MLADFSIAGSQKRIVSNSKHNLRSCFSNNGLCSLTITTTAVPLLSATEVALLGTFRTKMSKLSRLLNSAENTMNFWLCIIIKHSTVFAYAANQTKCAKNHEGNRLLHVPRIWQAYLGMYLYKLDGWDLNFSACCAKSTKAKKTSRTPNVAVPSIAQAYAPTIASSEHDIA